MRPRIKVVTLGVSNLERSLAFYRDGMGLPTKGIIGQEFEDDAVVFFNMNNDLILALYPTALLAKDARSRRHRRERVPCPSATSSDRKTKSMRS